MLADRAEILVGKGRYRFDAPLDSGRHEIGETCRDSTIRTVVEGAGVFRPPALTEVLGKGSATGSFS